MTVITEPIMRMYVHILNASFTKQQLLCACLIYFQTRAVSTAQQFRLQVAAFFCGAQANGQWFPIDAMEIIEVTALKLNVVNAASRT